MTSQPATSPGQGPDAAAQPLRASPERILQSLSQVALLRALPPEEVQAIVPHVERCHVEAGQRVFGQGEPGDALYLVERGRARVLADGQRMLGTVGPGEAFGEMALLTGEPRSATVVADTDLETWRISLEDFQQIIGASPRLEAALRGLAEQHRSGAELPRADADSAARGAWAGTALRALAARRRGIQGWQKIMGFGLLLWLLVAMNEAQGWLAPEQNQVLIAAVQLLAGLTILQGACEAFIQGVERLGARFRWEGFIAGTIGSMVATLLGGDRLKTRLVEAAFRAMDEGTGDCRFRLLATHPYYDPPLADCLGVILCAPAMESDSSTYHERPVARTRVTEAPPG